MMFDQQLDLDGGAHDIAPEHEQPKLFGSAPQLRGQIALDTDPNPVEYTVVETFTNYMGPYRFAVMQSGRRAPVEWCDSLIAAERVARRLNDVR